MDQSPTPALPFDDLRFNSTTISRRDKGGIIFGAIADLKRYLAKPGRWKGMMMQLPRTDLTSIKSSLKFDRSVHSDRL